MDTPDPIRAALDAAGRAVSAEYESFRAGMPVYESPFFCTLAAAVEAAGEGRDDA